MCVPIRRFKLVSGIWMLLFLSTGGVFFPAQAASDSLPALKKGDTSLYQDMLDQNLFYEGTAYLRFDRIYRKLFRKKLRAQDVNVFDEVPDSAFFTNRHGKKPLSVEDLAKGSVESSGPDMSGDVTVFYGEAEENPAKLWIRDAKGGEYLLKFDPQDSLELTTSSQVIAGRFYHALGYNVLQDSLITFNSEKLGVSEGAVLFDASGFRKNLTVERLQELVLFIPADAQGRLRAVATKLPVAGTGSEWSFTGRRPKIQEDKIDHAKRRSVRALQVFGAWLNNDDTRQSSSFFGGQYYLTDFDSALGAGNQGAKPPMLSYEHMADYGETTKAVMTLGLREKPWQKKWREAEEKTHSSAVGYFDNRHFDPLKFKTQLPYYAFKDLTAADGFWAAKMLMAFSDEDIRAIVKSGQYSDLNDEKYVSDVLIERRNLVAQAWFEKSNPLDEFDIQGNKLVFKDLGVLYGFSPEGKATYQAEVFEKSGKKLKKLGSLEAHETAFDIRPEWAGREVTIMIRTVRTGTGASKPGACVLVEFNAKGVSGVLHQD